MKVAFLSDIHANFPALCAALAAAERAHAETIVVAGDMVGGGPHPVEVVRLLAQRRVLAIAGNLERKLLGLPQSRKKLARLEEKRKTGHLVWTARQLQAAERAWLASLPATLDIRFGDVDVLVVHGSPASDSDSIYPSVTRAALATFCGQRRPQVLVCGHSHIPFSRVVGGIRVVNCGSVGRPVDGDPRGSLALVDFTRPERLRCSIVRFSFPLDDLAHDLEARGVPGARPDEHLRGLKRKGV